MLGRIGWLIATGVLAYVLEYGFGLRQLPTRYILYAAFVPLLALYAIDLMSPRSSGRLKGAKSIDSASKDASGSRDHLFGFLAFVYVAAYLAILLRVRPRDWDLVREIVLVLSPVELFWLIAPVVVFWWYRKRAISGNPPN